MLATFEVLGKLTFASASGWALDSIGLEPVFASFVVLGLLCVPASAALPSAVVASGDGYGDRGRVGNS